MSRISPAWSDAHTLADLGRLTADWLEGRLGGECPGYLDTTTDPETRHLIPVLAAANRRGYVTTNSQPGDDDRRYRQRAGVDGYVADQTLLRRITDEARRAGITVIAETPGAHTRGLAVTQKNRTLAGWRDVTWFGRSFDRRERVDLDWRGAGPAAIREAEQAVYLTLIDEDWGTDRRLWDALAKAIR